MVVLRAGMCPDTLHVVDYFPEKEEKYNLLEGLYLQVHVLDNRKVMPNSRATTEIKFNQITEGLVCQRT